MTVQHDRVAPALHVFALSPFEWACAVLYGPGTMRETLRETGFMPQALIAEAMLEITWLLGRGEAGRFSGIIAHMSGEAPENWLRISADMDPFELDEPSYRDNSRWRDYYPVDRADLRRLFYAPFELPIVEVHAERRCKIVPTQSGFGWTIQSSTELNDDIFSRIAYCLRIRLEIPSHAVREIVEAVGLGGFDI